MEGTAGGRSSTVAIYTVVVILAFYVLSGLRVSVILCSQSEFDPDHQGREASSVMRRPAPRSSITSLPCSRLTSSTRAKPSGARA